MRFPPSKVIQKKPGAARGTGEDYRRLPRASNLGMLLRCSRWLFSKRFREDGHGAAGRASQATLGTVGRKQEGCRGLGGMARSQSLPLQVQ
jgi:hypothetical protein